MVMDISVYCSRPGVVRTNVMACEYCLPANVSIKGSWILAPSWETIRYVMSIHAALRCSRQEIKLVCQNYVYAYVLSELEEGSMIEECHFWDRVCSLHVVHGTFSTPRNPEREVQRLSSKSPYGFMRTIKFEPRITELTVPVFIDVRAVMRWHWAYSTYCMLYVLDRELAVHELANIVVGSKVLPCP